MGAPLSESFTVRRSGVGPCGVCRSGWVQVSHGTIDYAYSCACAEGVLKQKHARPILALLSRAEVEDLWPDGVPASSSTVSDLLNLAGLAPAWHPHTLDTYGKAFGAHAAIKRYLALAADWIAQAPEARSDLVMFGPNGVGKTGLAVGLLQALVRRGDRPLFIDARVLLVRWRDTFRDGAKETEGQLLQTLITAPLLVVDECTAGGDTAWVERSLTLLVDQRQRHQRPTILTLNLPATTEDGTPLLSMQYGPLLAAALGPALYDRLRERAQFWHLAGESRRQRRSNVRPFPGATPAPTTTE